MTLSIKSLTEYGQCSEHSSVQRAATAQRNSTKSKEDGRERGLKYARVE